MEEWHALNADTVMKKLQATRQGLGEAEVQKRLGQYGKNTIAIEKKISLLKILINQFTNMLVLILLAAALVSFVIGTFPGQEESFFDALLIVAILLANGIFGFIQEYKAEKTLEALKRLAAPTATVMRNGKEVVIAVEDIAPGDILVLKEGDKVAADSRIVETLSLAVDESMLTGESLPVSKEIDTLKANTVLAERKNMLYMNTNITRGKALAVVVATGLQTEIGKIAEEIAKAEEPPSQFQMEIEEVGKKIAYIVLAVIIIVAITELALKEGELLTIFLIAVSLAVAAIPEGLPAVVTISLALGAQRMVKQHALMRKLGTIENFSSIDIICTDKTGTMTENRMTVKEIYFSGKKIQVKGQAFERIGEFLENNKKFDSAKLQPLMQCAALCNDARSQDDSFRGDPTEIAVLIPAYKAGMNVEALQKDAKRIDEVSFSSDRKMMTTVNEIGKKKIASTKGAAERVLERCTQIYDNGKIRKISKKDREGIFKVHNEMAANALRVLAFAYKENPKEKGENVEHDLIFLGLMGMIDPARNGVKEAITDCRNAGIRVVMLTGDNQLTAAAIGKELGFRPKSMNGQELDGLDEKELGKIVEQIDIFARTTPKHKVQILRALKANGHVVAMTGDGVNDAPSLQDSDVGIAMGIRGTEIAKEASDMILLDDNFVTIRNSIEQGRGIFDNIRKFVVYLLGANMAEVLVVFIASLFGLGLPLLAAHLLWINLLTDGLPALALGVDPPAGDVMQRKPRKDRHIIDKNALQIIFVIGLSATIPMLLMFQQHADNLIKAQTMIFTGFVFIEMLKVFLVREQFHTKLASNGWLYVAVVSSLILQLAVVYIPTANEFFDVVPLGISDWLAIAATLLEFLILFIIFNKLAKMIFERKNIAVD